jgi:hypothetical protein
MAKGVEEQKVHGLEKIRCLISYVGQGEEYDERVLSFEPGYK